MFKNNGGARNSMFLGRLLNKMPCKCQTLSISWPICSNAWDLNCRYKSLSLIIGFKFYVLWLYLGKACYFFKFRVHIGLRQVSYYRLEYSNTMPRNRLSDQHSFNFVFLKLAPSFSTISFHTRLFGIGLAYSHSISSRLFGGLMEINPVFLLISLCISFVLGINSFYYEYSLDL